MKMPKRFTMKRGIAAECLEKIFSLECKTSTPGTEKETGSVLGLLLCKEFIEKHGGRIFARPEPCQGSCFTFTLPVRESAG